MVSCESMSLWLLCHVPGDAQVIIFGDQCILHQEVDKWPYCDTLIAFYSSGFPLHKVPTSLAQAASAAYLIARMEGRGEGGGIAYTGIQQDVRTRTVRGRGCAVVGGMGTHTSHAPPPTL